MTIGIIFVLVSAATPLILADGGWDSHDGPARRHGDSLRRQEPPLGSAGLIGREGRSPIEHPVHLGVKNKVTYFEMPDTGIV